MLLNHGLPTSFEFEGREYSFNLSFDRVLDVIEVKEDSELTYEDKMDVIFEILQIQCDFQDRERILNHVFDEFIVPKSEEHIEYDLKGNVMPKRENPEEESTLSFTQDAGLIYASFRQAYNINLFNEYDNLHWFEFIELLNGLPESTALSQVRHIRSWKPSKGDTAEYKNKMMSLKEQFRIIK